MDSSLMDQAQHIWMMLDDMAENDPGAYRKFIDKQIGDGKKSMQPPEPHMCVVTSIKGRSQRLYINVLSWSRIPEPKSDEDPIPVTGGKVYEEQLENDDEAQKLISVAFSPKVLEQFGIESLLQEEQKLLINLAIDYIEDQHKLKLSRSYVLLPISTRYKGELQDVRKTLLSQFKTVDKQMEEDITELTQTFGPMSSATPESLLSQLSNISGDDGKPETSLPGKKDKPEISLLSDDKPRKKGLIEEVGSSELKRVKPNYELNVVEEPVRAIVLKVALPEVKSVAECDLDISEDDVFLEVSDKYELTVSLPHRIRGVEESSAKFSKKSRTLTLNLPILDDR